MCLQCRLLGAVINSSRESLGDESLYVCDKDDSQVIEFDAQIIGACYSPDKGRDDMDDAAAAYLAETISLFEKRGISLQPNAVATDGSCLPHALSKSLHGSEILYDALRASLVRELQTHENWYRENTVEGGLFDNETWQAHFPQLLHAAAPTRGRAVNRDKFLEGMHILAFANIFRRPILLIDSLQGKVVNQGLYPPARHTRKDIVDYHGRMPSILVLGWQSGSHEHYVPVSFVHQMPDLNPNPNDLAIDQDFRAIITEIRNYQGSKDLMFHLVQLLCTNSVTPASQAASTLVQLIRNVAKAFDKQVPMERLTFRMSNEVIRYKISSVSGATAVLQDCGFIEDIENGDAIMRFPRDNQYHKLTEREFALSILSRAQTIMCNNKGSNTPLSAENTPKLTWSKHIELISGEEEIYFGRLPLGIRVDDSQSPTEVWNHYREAYGEGDIKAGFSWSLSPGAIKKSPIRIETLMDYFEKLFAARYGSFNQVFDITTSSDLVAVITCSACSKQVIWNTYSQNVINGRLQPGLDLLQLDAEMNPDLTKQCTCGNLCTVHDTYGMKLLNDINSLYAKNDM